jgi:hypothetical protein
MSYRVAELSQLIAAVRVEAAQLEGELTAFPESQRPIYADVVRAYRLYVAPKLEDSQVLAYLLGDEESVAGLTPDMRRQVHALRDQWVEHLQQQLQTLRMGRQAGWTGHNAQLMKEFVGRADRMKGNWSSGI